MCDTICVTPKYSKRGAMMLAKNSDRDPNEPHVIRFFPALRHGGRATLKCTYISIPQAARTNAVLLFKPDWIWGAEMGVNEHGVAIGNEAVFTKARQGDNALTGMDMLRLALERSDSAENALETITRLLAGYGQGGNCGYSKDFRYDNSFLIADTKKAYVLETSGKNYAACAVKERAAISNRLCIRREHTLRSGIARGEDWARKFTEPLFSHFAKGGKRRAAALAATEGRGVDAACLMRALRSHAPGFDGFEFTRGSVESVCMHAGGIIGDHTTGSFIAVLRDGAPPTVWSTGASTPCIAAFKPVFFGINSGAPVFADETKGRQYWLERERLHRAVLVGLVDVSALRWQRDMLESKWLDKEQKLFADGAPDPKELEHLAKRAAEQERELINTFLPEEWHSPKGRGRFAHYWRDKTAKLTSY
ncbi:MAG: hypothetical protein WDA65_06215 [Christensenellales bacterium]